MKTSAEDLQQLNYFNYFTEVEEEFVRRRGSHMLISPLDWALVESWKNAGIPLHVVLRGINRAFDAHQARPRYRKVNSIFYCQQEVEAAFAEYKLARVGSAYHQTQESCFSRQQILDFIARSKKEILDVLAKTSNQMLAEALERTASRLDQIIQHVEATPHINAQSIEGDLQAADQIMLEGLRLAAPDQLQALRKEAKRELRSYKAKMDEAIYKQTIENFVSRRLRLSFGLPQLSLFYL
jgi:hypothetical protein